MAVLVVTYDNSTGGFKVQKVGSAQISDNAIVSGKVASGAMTAGMIPASLLSGATYSSIQDLINTTQSAGRLSGGTITATDPADGTVVVAAGTGFVKITDSPVGVTKFFDWPEETAFALTDNSVNYIFVRYRLVDSTPTVTIEVTTDRTTIEQNREFTLGRVYRAGNATHIVNSGIVLSNAIRRVHERLIQARGFERASGGIITEDGERYLKSSAGVFFLGANEITTDAQNTNNSDRFTWWYHSGGAWHEATGQQQVSNEQYDDGTDLANLTGKRYGVQWVFIHYDSDIQVVCGRGNYTLAEAEGAILPAVPSVVSEFSALAAKIIIQHEEPNFEAIVSAYEIYFPISYPPDHNDLTNIQGGTTDEYYHLTSGEHAKAISPTFLYLTDTPGSYSGQVTKFARVNVAEDALEFGSNVSGFTGLLATPQIPADESVTSAKLASGAVIGDRVAFGGIFSGKIAAGTIGGDRLINATITSAKIGANAVGAPHILDGSVGSAELAAGAVTSAKVGAGAIGNTHLRSGDVQHIRLGGIGASDHHAEFTSSMHSFAHPSALIANQAVTSAKIGALAVGTPHIRDLNVTSAKLAAAIIALLGSVADGAITSAKIAANAIGGPHILAGSILGGDLANQAITSAKIGANVIGNTHLYSGKVQHARLGSVTADQHHAQAHKDSHDPIDGADKLDTAAPVKVGSANAIGSSHSLARADHVHEREHAIYTHPSPPPCRAATAAQTGHATAAQISKLDGIASGADVTGANAPKAHKDSHDPIDGSDKLDTAAPVKVGSANAIGSSHSLARADHVHEREHAKYTDSEAVTAAKTVKLDDFATPDDVVDLNASTSRHGLLRKLDNVVTHFLNGQGGFTTPPAAGVTFDTTEVFNGNKSSTWEDLNLSGVVGANQAVVLLKVENASGSVRDYAFRRNGDTDEFYNVGNKQLTQVHLLAALFGYTIVVTDASGIIEWRSSAISVATILTMEAYWK